MILIEHGPQGKPALFDTPTRLLVAWQPQDVLPVLAQAEAARQGGAWVAGYLSYEAGHVFEQRLHDTLRCDPSTPLVVLGLYDAPRNPDSILHQADAQAAQARLAPLRPVVERAAYDAAFARLQDYIAAGDCYQINLTFPLASRLLSGTALGLYGALRAGQSVGFGAFIDIGVGPVIISRSPELFFQVHDGVIESRPMKGTAPRSDDPVRDAALRQELLSCEKSQAENLMIVDLLRNDIARISEIGSVTVPELFAIDSFATVHQMSSRVQGRLRQGDELASLMAALFPCGSITGAPKIRAMQIIAELEPHPRGVYCGAIGWAAPSGDQCWSVAIRTLRLSDDGEILVNVGGGVVQDSTAPGEWEEALWKARYMQTLISPD
ncbi:aminodeoxychorismate synthase component I [Roseinatronobacter alkalisoli]|uniref:Aminodeoxychorismate synthase component I n=1 Tax=Roseinatronobacter alkalisoli TaxID=3028235 RepID=A0ABT5TBZ8_9RHOB|nr:aminodeoxychorismate synthase component I [Roseinatronobacter sp. HJB301]MDD7972640.1 aminodeoxychorismate synthase component I [Roseinatronobacter sp. HJB301]